MTEQSKPDLPISAADFLEYVNTRNPNLEQMSPSDIVGYIKAIYLKPNWPHWRNMAEGSLQEAVWLSLDIEPWEELSDEDEAIEGISKRPANVVQQRYGIYLLNALRQDYKPRVTQCLAAIKAKELPARWRDVNDPYLNNDLTLRWYVSLEQFWQWGESLRHAYQFPDEFPRAEPANEQAAPQPPSSEKPPAPADDEPDTRTHRTYLRTIRALAGLANLIDDNGRVATGLRAGSHVGCKS